jgi:uncharacterized protein (TIGR02271 family)
MDTRRDAAGEDERLNSEAANEVVIPVVAEELTIETRRSARAEVRVHTRIETREEVIDTPVAREEVVVERIPVNKIVDGGDAVPLMREESGVLIIPVIEEAVICRTERVVREEIRVFKRRTTASTRQTVVLRREVVDIDREDVGQREKESDRTDHTEKEHEP